MTHTIGKTAEDNRKFFDSRPAAMQFANRGYELFANVEHVAVAFEPNFGFVALLYTRSPEPSAWAEGYEVRDMRVPFEKAKTPDDWAKPPKKAPKVTASGGVRPGGGATAQVWAIADELHEKSPLSRKDRAKVIDTCIEKGINKSTAATQWSKWAKDKGL